MPLAVKSDPQIAAKTGNPAGLLFRRIWYSVGKSGVLGITEYRQGRPLDYIGIQEEQPMSGILPYCFTVGLSLRLEDICKQGCKIHLRQTFVWVVSLPLVYCLSPSQLDWSEYTDVSWRNDNNNNILIYKAQLHKSAQSAVQLLRNAYKTYKLMMCISWLNDVCGICI